MSISVYHCIEVDHDYDMYRQRTDRRTDRFVDSNGWTQGQRWSNAGLLMYVNPSIFFKLQVPSSSLAASIDL